MRIPYTLTKGLVLVRPTVPLRLGVEVKGTLNTSSSLNPLRRLLRTPVSKLQGCGD